MITFKGAWVSRVGALGVLGLVGAGVGLGGCNVPAEASDVEELFSEEPKAGAQAGPCGMCLNGTCTPLGDGSYCCVGQRRAMQCGWQSQPDVWGQLPPEGGDTYSVSLSYGSTACEDSYVVGYPEQAPEDFRWLKQVVASVPSWFAPSTECECRNTVIMLEWEDQLCQWGPGQKALCAFGTGVARKSQVGVWGPNGCTVSASLSPEDAAGEYFFAATSPQLRATAIDRRTGEKQVVMVRTFRH